MENGFDLKAVWNRLSLMTSLRFKATSNASGGGWNGEGRGSVVVESADPTTLLFHENGQWKSEEGKELTFTNMYRWTALLETHSLRLEHLRFGHNHPVYLFDLKQSDDISWQSVEPHVCRDDLYTAVMTFGADVLDLHWTIQGPTKNERIHYSYQ